jgi:thiamine-phosphate diphosphorylase
MPFDRECLSEALMLCAVTDRRWIEASQGAHRRALEGQVADAIEGGATMIQLREKGLPEPAFTALARRVRAITSARGVPLIVNDSLEVALASSADGLHVGQDDGDPATMRKLLGPRAILGVTVHTVNEAIEAWRAGADYIGLGAAFPTGSKADASVLSREEMRAIAEAVPIPSIAIGGITAGNAAGLSGLGLAGIAAISAIFAEPGRVREATGELSRAAARVAAKPAAGDAR